MFAFLISYAMVSSSSSFLRLCTSRGIPHNIASGQGHVLSWKHVGTRGSQAGQNPTPQVRSPYTISLHQSDHFKYSQSCRMSPGIIPILQMEKLRLKNLRSSFAHSVDELQVQFCLTPKSMLLTTRKFNKSRVSVTSRA